MIPIHTRRRVVSGVVSSVLAVGFIGVAGCGGGNSTSPHGSGGASQQNQLSGTVFHVDLATGKVTVVPPAGHSSGALDAHALLGGTTVTFQPPLRDAVDGISGVRVLAHIALDQMCHLHDLLVGMGHDRNLSRDSVRSRCTRRARAGAAEFIDKF